MKKSLIVCIVAMCLMLSACSEELADGENSGRVPQIRGSSSESVEPSGDTSEDEEDRTTYKPRAPEYDDGGFHENLSDDGAYMSGSAIDVNGLRVAFLDYELDWSDYDDWDAPELGYKYVRAFFRFTNNSDESIYCGSYDFDCYADSVLCKSEYMGSANTLESLHELPSGRVLEGWVYFIVPESAQSVDLEYTYEVGDSEGKLVFTLP